MPISFKPAQGRRSAFTLAEVLVAAALGTIAIAISGTALVSVAKWYSACEAKLNYADQIKLIDHRIRPDCAGIGHFEIFDDYPATDGTPGTKIDRVNTRGGNMVVFVVVDDSNPLNPNPAITRIYGYYADVSAAEATESALSPTTPVRLRRFDSQATGTTSAAVSRWSAQFPATLSYAAANSSVAALLPPASTRKSWPEIARLDLGAIRVAGVARSKGKIDPNTGLPGQIFYGRPGALMMNLPIRYGTTREAYLVPLTLTFATHQ